MLVKMQRQIQKNLANIPNNIATRISLFKEEIERLLKQHNIEDLNQIKDIKTPGIITLETGKVISIAPLKYYQIHELLEWWMSVKLGRIELSESMKNEIDARYEKEFSTYKNKLKADLLKVQKSTAKRKEVAQKEATIVLKKLRKQNEPQVLALKETYRDQKAFLNQLFEERQVEETEIHERYQTKFDDLLKATQAKANSTQKFIQNITLIQYIYYESITKFFFLRSTELVIKRTFKIKG